MPPEKLLRILNRYFTELEADPDAEVVDEWELHNLTRDPEERANLALDPPRELDGMRAVLALTRGRKRLTPRLTVRG